MPQKLGYVVALDLGSTSFKAALFDGGLNRVASRSLPVVYSRLAPPCFELAPEWVWQAVIELIGGVCGAAGIEPDKIARLSVTSQAQTFALIGDGGSMLSPFISWRDNRAETQAAALVERYGDAFHRHCSLTPTGELMVSKVLWLREHVPALFDQVRSIALLPSWITERLAGIDAVDRNQAAMTGLYSLDTGGWWPEVLALCGLREAQLPALVDTGAPIPAKGASAGLRLAGEAVIVCAGNDQSCGSFANGCSEDVVIVTLGTALIAYRFAGYEPGPYREKGCWGPYPGGGYYELAFRSQGCAALDWACEQLFPGGDLDAFFEMAAAEKARRSDSPAGADASAEESLFYPERTGAAEAWTGSRRRGRRTLAVLEGIGFSLRQLIIDDLGMDRRLRSIVAVGGGGRSDFWLQLLADVLDTPVQRGGGDALLGAAMMAAPDAAPLSDVNNATFFPQPAEVERYRDLFQRWRAG